MADVAAIPQFIQENLMYALPDLHLAAGRPKVEMWRDTKIKGVGIRASWGAFVMEQTYPQEFSLVECAKQFSREAAQTWTRQRYADKWLVPSV